MLAGNPDPPLFTWEELAAQRWGPAVGDPTPGIVNDHPHPARMLAALREAAANPDEDGLAERAAIRAECDELIESESRRTRIEEGGLR